MTRVLSLPLLILTKGMKEKRVVVGFCSPVERGLLEARRALCPGATTPIAAA